MTALHSALRGLSTRQRVIATNVSNIETPGYLAGRVNFESSLRGALAAGDNPNVQATTGRSLEPTRMNGNNVNLDEETLSLMDTGLQYQLAVNAINSKFSLLRTAIKGGV